MTSKDNEILKDNERKTISELYMKHAQECLRAAEDMKEEYRKSRWKLLFAIVQTQ